ncbi:peptide deformylase [Sphingobacterium yanglingense]|nr:peptide deformylase [Sphingobacterium yanglingense]
MKSRIINTIILYFATTAAMPLFSQTAVHSTIEDNQMGNSKIKGFNKSEKSIILAGQTDSKLHVYQTTDEKELIVLKSKSSDIDPTDPLLPTLEARMLLTVQDPNHSGVGIAAPQIGINRNLIWVQRFDKTDDPFEFYINPRIIWKSKLTRLGAEGCLSIPDRKEEIQRSYAIRLQYQDKKGQFIEENIEGFTAVIFQHEVDHLLGILYPDRLEEQTSAGYIELNEKIPFSLQIDKKTILP